MVTDAETLHKYASDQAQFGNVRRNRSSSVGSSPAIFRSRAQAIAGSQRRAMAAIVENVVAEEPEEVRQGFSDGRAAFPEACLRGEGRWSRKAVDVGA
jgi:hypothetical protein